MNYIFFIILSLVIIAIPVQAIDTNTDGTAHPHGITSSGLNTVVDFNDNIFNITGGTQKEGNLFHSFEKFNLHTGEGALFNDYGIQNTIGRITGADYSWINGKIYSSAANLYLINPNGIMFGPNVSLNIAGSFYASTADYLRLRES